MKTNPPVNYSVMFMGLLLVGDYAYNTYMPFRLISRRGHGSGGR